MDGITQAQIDAIRLLRERGLTIGEISVHPAAQWPERKSLELLEQIAGPIPKNSIGELLPRGPVFKVRVGNLYAGKW